MSESNSEDGSAEIISITEGASLFFLGQIARRAMKLLLNVILTRGIGANLYGVYSYATSILSILIILARVGAGKSILRYIPSYEGDLEQQNNIAGLSYMTVLVGSTIVGGSLYLLAPIISEWTLDNPLFVSTLQVLALVLPFNAVFQLTNAMFRGLERLEYQIFLSSLVEPLVKLIIVIIALLIGYSLLGIVAGIAVGAILTCTIAISMLYLRTQIRPNLIISSNRGDLYEFYNYSIPLTLKDIGSILYTRVDILMVGFFLLEADVGVYRIIVLVASTLTLPLTAFNQLFPPIASRLYTNDQISELESVYATVTRWTITLVLLPGIIIILYSSEVLAIFGPEFTTGTFVLTIFIVGQLTNCFVGPSGYLLMMTNHQYLSLLNQWILGVLNVILNYVLILKYGISGAAIATAATLSLINLLRVFEIKYTEEMFPYSRQFWKPLVAGAIGGIISYIPSFIWDGFLSLSIGSILGFVCYAALLVIFGISYRDRALFRELTRGLDRDD